MQDEQEEAVEEDEDDEVVVAGLVGIGRLARRPYIKCYNQSGSLAIQSTPSYIYNVGRGIICHSEHRRQTVLATKSC